MQILFHNTGLEKDLHYLINWSDKNAAERRWTGLKGTLPIP